MKKFLAVDGALLVTPEMPVINTLYELALKYDVQTQLVKKESGLSLVVGEDTLGVGEEGNFCEFLASIGRAVPGKVVGELEVWWPMALESGPQWWTLNEAGQLFVTESEIVRGEPALYGG